MAHGIGILPAVRGAKLGILAAVEDDADHLGHLATGDDALGIKGAGVLALDDAELNQGIDGVGVNDLTLVGEILGVRSRGADEHHAGEHGASQTQAENALEIVHGNSSFCFWRGVSFCRKSLKTWAFSEI